MLGRHRQNRCDYVNCAAAVMMMTRRLAHLLEASVKRLKLRPYAVGQEMCGVAVDVLLAVVCSHSHRATVVHQVYALHSLPKVPLLLHLAACMYALTYIIRMDSLSSDL